MRLHYLSFEATIDFLLKVRRSSTTKFVINFCSLTTLIYVVIFPNQTIIFPMLTKFLIVKSLITSLTDL